jgi:hemerythrin
MQTMTFFNWHENLSVGNKFIDGDHRHLIDLVNQLYDAIDKGRAESVAGRVLDELIQYTKEHFKREEAVMQRIDYAEFSAHKAEHENLTQQVIALREKFQRCEQDRATELLVFLYDLLFNHIIEVDKKLANAIQASASAS